jgi:hypothetical protein
VIFDGLAVPVSGTIYSAMIDVLGYEGYFGLLLQVTGSGTLAISYKVGIFDTLVASPSSGYSLITGLTSTGGPLSDGKTYLSFNPPVCRYLQLLATETGGANSPVLTAHLIGA